MSSLKDLLSGGNHLDIYLNHNCNLRCSHCFVGQQLNSMVDMTWSTFTSIIDKAHIIGVSKITLLGGEPTIYPHVSEACNYILSKNIDEVRVVTNGTKPYSHLLDGVEDTSKIFTIFSIDGATKQTHDTIRGEGVFDQLTTSIEKANSLGLSIAGITSLSKKNYKEIDKIMRLSDKHNLEYLNIHKTSSTGFASKKDLLSAQEWLDLRSRVIEISCDVDVPIKFDRKYVAKSEYHVLSEYQKECFVKSGSGGNIMIYPDGRVYRCSLFMDKQDNHDYEWDDNEIVENETDNKTEKSICDSCNDGCPGISSNGMRGKSSEYTTLCMYRKEFIKDGKVSVYK